MLEPLPDSATPLPEAAVQSDSTKLAEQLTQCLNKLQGVSFELSAAVDGFSDAHDKLREEIGKLGLKIERQANALTTVGASLAAETNEVGKLLKAFDKFASNFRWSFSGKHSVEENLGFLQARIVEQTGGLEASLGGALAGISGVLEQFRQNTAREIVPPLHPHTFHLRHLMLELGYQCLWMQSFLMLVEIPWLRDRRFCPGMPVDQAVMPALHKRRLHLRQPRQGHALEGLLLARSWCRSFCAIARKLWAIHGQRRRPTWKFCRRDRGSTPGTIPQAK